MIEQFLQLFTNNLIPCVVGSSVLVLCTEVNSFIKNNYSLKKNSKIENVTTALLPPNIIRHNSSLNEEELLKKQIGEYALEFFNKMSQILPEEDQILLINNLNNLNEKSYDGKDIEKLSDIFRNIKVINFINIIKNQPLLSGVYFAEDNSIQYKKGSNSKKALFHELFHLSSSFPVVQNETQYVGFGQIKNGIKIGESLNEGFTELLNMTYFFGPYKQALSYKYSTQIADGIRFIVGKENMEHYYFNANLKGLVDHLKEYSSEEEVNAFITKTDIVHNYILRKNLNQSSLNTICDLARDVNDFILKTAVSKSIEEQRENGKIPFYGVIAEETRECFNKLPHEITYGLNNYKIIDDNAIEKAYKEVNANIGYETNRRSHRS